MLQTVLIERLCCVRDSSWNLRWVYLKVANGQGGCQVGKASKRKDERRQEREHNVSRRLWHGGIGGLKVSDYLLPPIITNDPLSVSNHIAEARADRVYMTTDLELARSYAAEVQSLGRRSGLYRVEPIGTPEIDPDFPSVGFSARRARVVEVVAENIELSSPERLKRAARYLAWDDGRPMYSADGKIQLTKELEAIRVGQGEVDTVVPAWTEPEQALVLLHRAFASRASSYQTHSRARLGPPLQHG